MNVYDSLLDVPLDEYADDDHDDSVIPEGEPHSAPLELGLPQTVGQTAIVVPFIASKRGDSGKHIRALNRALSKAGFRRWQLFSLKFTVWVEAALKKFQKKHGLPVTGVYDKATHAKLAPYYDAYAIKYLLLAPVPVPTKDQTERAEFMAALMYLYNIRYQLPYTQRRPGDCRKPPSGADCSFSGEWAAHYSPIGGLSGYSFCGYGNTGSQLTRFRNLGRVRESISSALPGDPKYFGSSTYNPTHVAFFIGRKDGVARVWSFGSFPAKILDAAYRHDGIAVCNLTGR